MPTTSTKIIDAIVQHAESIKCDLPQQFPVAASPGDTFRQGDLYITLLDDLPEHCVYAPQQDLQLAPGQTKGSRHILDHHKGVAIYFRARSTPLDGPILHLTEQRTVTHPEHGHVILPPGIYAITYQRAYDPLQDPHSSTFRRVMD